MSAPLDDASECRGPDDGDEPVGLLQLQRRSLRGVIALYVVVTIGIFAATARMQPRADSSHLSQRENQPSGRPR